MEQYVQFTHSNDDIIIILYLQGVKVKRVPR